MRIQFLLFTVLVFFTGVYLGEFRVAYPLEAAHVFNLAELSLVIFGFGKGIMNFASGFLSDVYGRKVVLTLGWLMAIPLPIVALIFHSLLLVALLTMFLAINQAMTWTTTITSQIDISRGRTGLAAGVNEASGYAGVTMGSLIAGYLLSVNVSPYILMGGVATTSFLLSFVGARETRPVMRSGKTRSLARGEKVLEPSVVLGLGGLLEKFVDAFFWLIVPAFLTLRGVNPLLVAYVVGTYVGVWTIFQPLTGYISDRMGRKVLILAGFLLMTLGMTLFMLNYFASALICGAGMAMVYPTLIAAVSDYSPPEGRGTSLGVYRLLRDSGYGVAGLLGLLVMRGDIFTYSETASLTQLVGFLSLMLWFALRSNAVKRTTQ
ncbi:MAG: MFS transporter [Metallosphaera yellowstonensis]|jgi:Arabinose efflux permease|uniref:Arabinose efflux permease family protein n=1 Tax=Metallosphaera yellowstonensis MK1 TaxID=671065 RepID=H2C1M3_9CREN|nr:MFS transporter [Metallosphaera yellowstonensis]EHP70144.1 arabinose efflux permease family protein [Metallosphaera yellowstonensis MK1]